jgi:hypothetical protein
MLVRSSATENSPSGSHYQLGRSRIIHHHRTPIRHVQLSGACRTPPQSGPPPGSGRRRPRCSTGTGRRAHGRLGRPRRCGQRCGRGRLLTARAGSTGPRATTQPGSDAGLVVGHWHDDHRGFSRIVTSKKKTRTNGCDAVSGPRATNRNEDKIAEGLQLSTLSERGDEPCLSSALALRGRDAWC